MSVFAHGLLDLSPWQVIIATLVITHVTIIAVTVFLHRSQAHRALDLHPILNHFFRFWLWITTGMVTKEWVAIHRKHHAKCETPEDPHSPQILGIRKILFDGVEPYRREAKNPETLTRYGHGTPADWLEHNFYDRGAWGSILGLSIMLVADVLLFGVLGVTVWAVQMIWIPFFAAGVINGIGHYWGYRNYETADASRNIVPWGILIGGEELHNNHHAFSSSAKLSSLWWEFDIGWLYIRLFELLGLAKVRKVAPKPRRIPGKQVVDLDTLRAVVLGRFHVMADFARNVVMPVLRDEFKKIEALHGQSLRRNRALLLRSEERMDAQERDRLHGLLQISHALRTVLEFRGRLQGMWGLTTASHDKLLAVLQEWCAQAEASGIRALQEFAARLRSYSLQQPA
ncbi:MAG: fatty acid desaturase [Gammaproteobacteria bacterium]